MNCPFCNRPENLRFQRVTFSNGMEHRALSCVACNKFIKYISFEDSISIVEKPRVQSKPLFT